MMLRMLVVVVLFWGCIQVAFGEEAVLNNPPSAVSVLKEVVAKLDPNYETLWTYSDGTFSQGVSASLWNFTSNEIHVASIRLGYGTGERLYGGLGLDLPGLTKRFVPAQVKGVVTTAPFKTLWTLVGRFARVTPIAGYDWQENKAIYGVALGAALTW